MRIVYTVILFAALAWLEVSSNHVPSPPHAGTITRKFEILNETWFYFSPSGVTVSSATEALNICNDFDMRLVSLQTAEKQKLITDYLDANGLENDAYWTSGVRYGTDLFVWSGTGEIFTYTKWSANFPLEGDRVDVCVTLEDLNWERQWHDRDCTSTGNGYICEE